MNPLLSPNILQSWLLDTVCHFLVNNNKGEGKGVLTFFPRKGGGGGKRIYSNNKW